MIVQGHERWGAEAGEGVGRLGTGGFKISKLI